MINTKGQHDVLDGPDELKCVSPSPTPSPLSLLSLLSSLCSDSPAPQVSKKYGSQSKKGSRFFHLKKRKTDKEERLPDDPPVYEFATRKHVVGSLPNQKTADMSFENEAIHASTSYVGLAPEIEDPSTPCLEDLEGYEYVKWDGLAPLPICDEDGRIVLVMVGQPNDEQWDRVI
ncbi:hypothetical protein V5O48_018066, partial [Marasmius crinis-equi]